MTNPVGAGIAAPWPDRKPGWAPDDHIGGDFWLTGRLGDSGKASAVILVRPITAGPRPVNKGRSPPGQNLLKARGVQHPQAPFIQGGDVGSTHTIRGPAGEHAKPALQQPQQQS